jgi:hypothetical protein
LQLNWLREISIASTFALTTTKRKV